MTYYVIIPQARIALSEGNPVLINFEDVEWRNDSEHPRVGDAITFLDDPIGTSQTKSAEGKITRIVVEVHPSA